MRKPLLFDTQNPGISEFSTAHAYKYKTKREAKMKQDSRKMPFLLIIYQVTFVLEKHRFTTILKTYLKVEKINLKLNYIHILKTKTNQ